MADQRSAGTREENGAVRSDTASAASDLGGIEDLEVTDHQAEKTKGGQGPVDVFWNIIDGMLDAF